MVKKGSKKLPEQKNEESTADKILISAQKLFVAHGFAGTSISDIANDAKINKSLIYHHFENKEKLWLKVKDTMVEKFSPNLQSYGQHTHGAKVTLRSFIEDFVTKRFEFYLNNPDMVRLIHWQRIEDKEKPLTKDHLSSSLSIISQNTIEELQKKKEIRNDVPTDLIRAFILTTTSAIFLIQPHLLYGAKDKKITKKYLELLIDSLMDGLRPRKP